MKKSYIVNLLTGMGIALLAFSSCKSKQDHQTQATHAAHQQYTCPMHPQISSDQPGKCPVCGMDLVLKATNKEMVVDSSIAGLSKPVNARVVAAIPAITAESGSRIISSEISGVVSYDTRNKTTLSSRVSGRVEKLLIKYNFQPVHKGQLIMTIYSPELAAAQRELLYIAANSPALLPAAKKRLELLGMQASELNAVLRSGKILYRVPVYSPAAGYILERPGNPATANAMPAAVPGPADNGMSSGMTGAATNRVTAAPATAPLLLRQGAYVKAGASLFTIYQNKTLVAEFAIPPKLASGIKQGQKLLYYPTGNREAAAPGRIGLIEPALGNDQHFTMVRVYFSNATLRPGQLITASIPLSYTKGWWLPQKAVRQLGQQSILYRKNGTVFRPVPVMIGATANGMIQVLTDIADWEVAADASYMVDSESFTKINDY